MTPALARTRALLDTPPPDPIPGQLDLTRSDTVTKTTDRPKPSTPALASDALASDRHVVEHALTNYGYSPETARLLVDRLIAEGGNS